MKKKNSKIGFYSVKKLRNKDYLDLKICGLIGWCNIKEDYQKKLTFSIMTLISILSTSWENN